MVITILMGVKCYLIVVLICISLMIRILAPGQDRKLAKGQVLTQVFTQVWCRLPGSSCPARVPAHLEGCLVFQIQCKLFVFDKTSQSWVERGRGLLRLNDMASTDDGTLQSRLGELQPGGWG